MIPADRLTDGVHLSGLVCTVLRVRVFSSRVAFLESVTTDARVVTRFAGPGAACHRLSLVASKECVFPPGSVVSASGEMQLV